MSNLKDVVFAIDTNELASLWPRLKDYLECLGFDTSGVSDKLVGTCAKRKNSVVVLACYGKNKGCRLNFHGDNHPTRMLNRLGSSPIPNDFQAACASHMKGAPEDLAEYVRERMGDTPISEDWNRLYESPIAAAKFNWRTSPEPADFWKLIVDKDWDLVVRDFWKRGRKEWPLAQMFLGDVQPQAEPEESADPAHVEDEPSGRPGLSEQHFTANDIDLAYLVGVFNVSGIDGLHKEIERLRELNMTPSQMISKLKSGNNA